MAITMPKDCRYIRKIVRANSMLPGSIEHLVVQTHITQCAECRRILNRPSPTLLGELLSTSPAPPPPQSPKNKQVQSRPAPQPAKSKPAQPSPSRGMVWAQSFLICLATILISYLVVMGARSGWATFRIFRNLTQISATTAPTATFAATTPTTVVPTVTAVPAIVLPAGSDQPITVLVLGSDRRPNEKTPSRTDCVMLLRINPQTQHVSFLSFPRDLIVSIPGYGAARINSAHVYGDIYPALGGGEKLATKTVGQLIGVPIDYTVYTDFAGFISIIDTLGGVPVNITKELYDGQFPTMDYKYREVSFPVGTGIAKRLQTGNFVETIEATANITDALIGHAHTDMPRDLIIAMAWQMRAIPTNNFTYNTFSDIYYGTGEDRYAMYPTGGAIKRIVTRWLGQ